MKHRLLISFFVLGVFSAHAAPIVTLQEGITSYPMGHSLEFLKDPEQQWAIEDVSSGTLSKQFVSSTWSILNFGASALTVWVRFRLKNESSITKDWMLEVQLPTLDQVDLYTPSAQGGYALRKQGQGIHAEEEIDYLTHLFQITLLPGTEQTFYIRYHDELPILFPLVLWDADIFLKEISLRQLWNGLYYGGMFTLILYNLFLFFSIRDRLYLYYLLYIAAYCVHNTFDDGLIGQYWFTDASAWFINRGQALFAFLTGSFWVPFIQEFFHTKEKFPRCHRYLMLFLLLCGVMVTCHFFVEVPWLKQMFLILMASTIFLLLLASVITLVLARKQDRYAIVILGAFLVFLGIVGLRLSAYFGMIPANALALYGLKLCLILEIIFLSFSLAGRFNDERKRKELAQQETLKAQEQILESQQVRMDYQNQMMASQQKALEALEAREITHNAILEYKNELLLAHKVITAMEAQSQEDYERMEGYQSFFDKNNPPINQHTIYIEKINRTPYAIVYYDDEAREITARIEDFLRVYGKRYPHLLRISPSIIVNIHRVITIQKDKKRAKSRTNWVAIVRRFNQNIELPISNRENKELLEKGIYAYKTQSTPPS